MDTFFVSGADTVYYNFNTVREDTTHCSREDGFYEYGLNPKGASWLGEKVIAKSAGEYVFFNKLLDSVFLKPHGQTGERWRMFELGSGSYMEAAIDSVTLQDIFGVYDSVKVITLQAKDSVQNPIAHPLNAKQIRIAKHFGFTSLPHFYEFPDDTTIYRIHNKGALTWREVYDFEAGDRMQRYQKTQSCMGNKDGYVLYTYLSKTVSNNFDSVIYQTTVDSHFFYRSLNDWDSILSERHARDTILLTYPFTTQPVTSILPEEIFNQNIPYVFSGLGNYSLSGGNVCGGRKMNFSDYNFYQVSDSCLLPYIDGGNTQVVLAEGLGTSYVYSISFMCGWTEEQYCFIQKSSCTYGQLYTGISNPAPIGGEISIYPNPATTEVIITGNVLLSMPARLTLSDIAGKEIYSATVPQFPAHIATGAWSAGYYILSVRTDTGSVKRKLLVVE